MRSDDQISAAHPGFQVRPWRGAQGVALLVPTSHGAPVTAAAVEECVSSLQGQGQSMAVTPALSTAEQAGFLASGFAVQERLHLLTHDLAELPDPVRPVVRADGTHRSPEPASRPPRLRRAHRRDRTEVLSIDAAAFDAFWRLDSPGLDEALAATPVSRFRVGDAGPTAGRDPHLAGYAVCGRAGRRGYVQRLAVDPRHQGSGLGRALVVDGLRWMRQRGVLKAAVNTQESNVAALSLYEQLGFRRQADGLAVLSLPLQEEPG